MPADTSDRSLIRREQQVSAGSAVTAAILRAQRVDSVRPTTGLVHALPGGRYALNLTAFYHAVKSEFEAYCAALREGDVELRRRFRVQMEDMLRKS